MESHEQAASFHKRIVKSCKDAFKSNQYKGESSSTIRSASIFTKKDYSKRKTVIEINMHVLSCETSIPEKIKRKNKPREK